MHENLPTHDSPLATYHSRLITHHQQVDMFQNLSADCRTQLLSRLRSEALALARILPRTRART